MILIKKIVLIQSILLKKATYQTYVVRSSALYLTNDNTKRKLNIINGGIQYYKGALMGLAKLKI